MPKVGQGHFATCIAKTMDSPGLYQRRRSVAIRALTAVSDKPISSRCPQSSRATELAIGLGQMNLHGLAPGTHLLRIRRRHRLPTSTSIRCCITRCGHPTASRSNTARTSRGFRAIKYASREFFASAPTEFGWSQKGTPAVRRRQIRIQRRTTGVGSESVSARHLNLQAVPPTGRFHHQPFDVDRFAIVSGRDPQEGKIGRVYLPGHAMTSCLTWVLRAPYEIGYRGRSSTPRRPPSMWIRAFSLTLFFTATTRDWNRRRFTPGGSERWHYIRLRRVVGERRGRGCVSRMLRQSEEVATASRGVSRRETRTFNQAWRGQSAQVGAQRGRCSDVVES